MGKLLNKQNIKNQNILKIGVGGKWEKIGKKKVIKASEKLQPIQEVDKTEEKILMSDTNNGNEDENKNRQTNNGTSKKEMKENMGEVKLLVTKQKEITKDEDDQDIVIKTLCNIQDIIEYQIQNNLIEGVKDMMEKDKVLKDICCYSDWLSEPKDTGNRVVRVEIYFTVITSVKIRELV